MSGANAQKNQGRPRQLPDDPLTDPCVRISLTGLFKTTRFARLKQLKIRNLKRMNNTWTGYFKDLYHFLKPYPVIASTL